MYAPKMASASKSNAQDDKKSYIYNYLFACQGQVIVLMGKKNNNLTLAYLLKVMLQQNDFACITFDVNFRG